MTICPRCSSQAQGRFCHSCGAALSENRAPAHDAPFAGDDRATTLAPTAGPSIATPFTPRMGAAPTESGLSPTTPAGTISPPAPRNSRRRKMLAVVAVAALAGISAAGAMLFFRGNDAVGHVVPAIAEKHTVSGTMTVYAGTLGYKFGEFCSGRGGYDDIQVGTNVTIKDGTGTIIGTGSLGRGRAAEPVGVENYALGCEFSFRVPDVRKAAFYEVEVSHRGGLTFSYDELKTKGWFVRATLG